MSRQGSSFGFFGLFGRSSDLRSLDTALRESGLHPALMPEGVKLAVVNMMKDRNGGSFPPEDWYEPVCSLIAYGALGAEALLQEKGARAVQAVEARIETALEQEEGLDCDILLLLHHATLLQPSVVERFDINVA